MGCGGSWREASRPTDTSTNWLLRDFRDSRHDTQYTHRLGIHNRLEVNAWSLICFSMKEEAGDTDNRGDPFSPICRLRSPGFVVQAKLLLMNTGYLVSADGTA